MATKGPDRPRLPAHYPATVDEILTAQQQGEAAATAGAHVSTCPYRPSDGTSAEEAERGKFLRLMWARAYRHAQAEQREATTGE